MTRAAASALVTGEASLPLSFPTASTDITAQSVSFVKIGVKADGVPDRVGASVPARFTLYDGDRALTYKARLTWIGR